MRSSKTGAITMTLSLLVIPYAVGSQASTDQWASIAVLYYIDTNNGNAGRCSEPYNGWDIKRGSHARRSMVKSQSKTLEPRIKAAIKTAFEKESVPEGIEVPPASAVIWTIEGGSVVVTFEARAASNRTETEDAWDEALDKPVQVPSYANLLAAAVWVKGDTATIVQQQSRPDAYLQTYYFAVDLHDVVDIDLDGNPEVVLHERAYEWQGLNVFTVRSDSVAERVRLQGCAL